ncbi:MAG: histidine kinase N-terminal 7TM domain-containing protein [Myxococcota bacterium]|nr:histidine kinase N-terminal 7TM domain-containing protein [Myxococcota bacterium]
MVEWEVATALAITLLVGLATHVFYRRPPKPLWPALPLLFGSALIFSVGDLLANGWPDNELILWLGMILVYTGLLAISPSWWLFTSRFSQWAGYDKVALRSGLKYLVGLNVLLWIGFVTNPWHGYFLETHAAGRSSYGPLWYLTAIPNYAVVVAAMCIHAKASLRMADPVIRSQCRYLAVAAAIPVVLNMAYVWSFEPFSYDPTALGFALSCAVFWAAVERRDLFVLERVSLPSVLSDDADASLIVSLSHRLLFGNPAADALFGPGVLVPGIAVDALLARVVPSFLLSGTTERPSKLRPVEEHRFECLPGDKRWVVIEVSLVNSSRGVPAGFSLRLRDHTALRTARDEASENLALLNAVDEAMGEGIVVKDAEGEIRYVNAAFHKLFGLSREQVLAWGQFLQRGIGAMLEEAPRGPLARMWHRSAEQFDPTSRESADLVTRDGRIIKVETFGISTPEGFRGRAWRLADVTQARQESRAMIQTQKLEGLGVLAGGIAHDFNNLLVAILGNAELAREQLAANSEAQAPLADVEAAAVRASELTGQLLAYAGKAAISKEDIDLSALIQDANQLVSLPKSIKIVARLEENLPLVHGGSAELLQVVMNLLTNAADAIGDPGGTITIETGRGEARPLLDAQASVERGETRDPTVYVSVSDDGHGMDQATLEKIFDPFYTTRFTGRGLGLAATQGILESHDGSMKIETAVGVGSTFSVMLPIKESAALPVVAAPVKEEEPVFSGYRVLVVDDEESVLSLLTKRLEALDFEVVTAASGEMALTLLSSGGPALVDLVILDLTMPGLGGIETHARIREDFPELPVLLSSGYPEETVTIFQNGHAPRDGFIQKPYRSAMLVSHIQRLLVPEPREARQSSSV